MLIIGSVKNTKDNNKKQLFTVNLKVFIFSYNTDNNFFTSVYVFFVLFFVKSNKVVCMLGSYLWTQSCRLRKTRGSLYGLVSCHRHLRPIGAQNTAARMRLSSLSLSRGPVTASSISAAHKQQQRKSSSGKEEGGEAEGRRAKGRARRKDTGHYLIRLE